MTYSTSEIERATVALRAAPEDPAALSAFAQAVTPFIMVRCWDVTDWADSLLQPEELPGLLWPHAVREALRWPGPEKCSITQWLWLSLRVNAVYAARRWHRSGMTMPIHAPSSVVSLSTLVGPDSGTDLEALLPEASVASAAPHDPDEIPWDALKPAAASIVREYFFAHRTLKEIGAARGLSKQRISILLAAALRTLRHAINERQFQHTNEHFS